MGQSGREKTHFYLTFLKNTGCVNFSLRFFLFSLQALHYFCHQFSQISNNLLTTFINKNNQTMKKKLLLLCALFTAVTGAWAQTNYAASANGGTIHPATGAPTTFYAENLDRTTQTELNGLIDGNTSAAHYIGGYTSSSDNTGLINSFYLDLGEGLLNYKTIKMYWEGAYASGYTIYGSNSTADLTANKLKEQTETPTNGNGTHQDYTLDAAASYRYIYFDFSSATAANYGWGVKLFEIEVIEEFTQVLSTITLSSQLLQQGVAVNVTASAFDQLASVFAGTVTYAVSPTTGVSVSGNTISFTAEASGTYTVTGTDEDGNTATANVYFVGSPATQTATSENVIALYSNQYGVTSGYTYYGDAPATFEYASGKNALRKDNGTIYVGKSDGTIKDYKYLHMSVYVAESRTVRVEIDGPHSGQNVDLTAGQWNDIKVNYEDYLTTERSFADDIKYVTIATGGETMLVDNVYFEKVAADAFDIEVASGVATVTGNVATAENIAAIEAADAMFIDLTGVTAISQTFTPKHKNAIIRLSSEDNQTEIPTKFSALSGMKNLVYNTTYFKPYAQLEFTDEAGEEFWNGQNSTVAFLSTGSTGYQITRSIAAGKWVTAYIPAETDIPSGISAYTADAENTTTSKITFKKISGTKLSANTAYVLHNTTGAAIDLVVSGTSDLTLKGTKDAVTIAGDVKSVGTVQTITCDGSQYALSNGQLHQINQGKVGAFRVYFTGLNTSTAPAVFIDGDSDDNTTKIGAIDAEGNISGVGEAYNLNGQRVARPTKGIFVVNGKKVVVK